MVERVVVTGPAHPRTCRGRASCVAPDARIPWPRCMLDEVGRLLGVSGALPLDAVRVAAVHTAYAQALAEHRHAPAELALLLESPPAVAGPRDTSDAELLVRGARAIARWILAGAPAVSARVYLARLEACSACPQLRTPPHRLFYDLALVPRSEASVCALCGCVAGKKAWLATETCPETPPRWPIVPEETRP